MTLVIHPNENNRETQCRLALQKALTPGETLLEYQTGKYQASTLSGVWYWIGITEQRFIFIRQNKPQQACSIYFPFILKVNDPPLNTGMSNPKLRITLSGNAPRPELLTFSISGKWTPYFENMAKVFEQYNGGAMAERPAVITTELAAQQVNDLKEMGAFPAAQAVLHWRMTVDPYLAANPAVVTLQRSLADLKLGMIVGAIAFLLVLVYFVVMAINGMARIGFGTLLAAIAAFELLRGHPAARSTALALAILTSGFNLISVLFSASFSILDPIMWVSFSLALALLLAGNPNRGRVVAGGLLFTVGVVGVIAFAFLGPSFVPGVYKAVMGIAAAPFKDDFSTDNGWSEINQGSFSAGREAGAYFVMQKATGRMNFLTPPITFSPVRAEVDVKVAPGFTSTQGGIYGLTCLMNNDATNYYAVMFSPLDAGYLIVHVVNDEEVPLMDSWLDATGLKAADQTNHIGLECQNNTLTVTLNGATLKILTDPSMAQAIGGDMGLVLGTSSDLPAGGFKALFDNAVFWPQN